MSTPTALSWRLVGGGQALGDTQSDGMGEGWSDFYGSEPAERGGRRRERQLRLRARMPATRLAASATPANYYFGIRRYPYTTDMTQEPV